jgi:hypothetical protein
MPLLQHARALPDEWHSSALDFDGAALFSRYDSAASQDKQFLVFVIQDSRLVSASAGVEVQERGGLRLGPVRAHLIYGRAVDYLSAPGIGAYDFNLKLHVASASTLELSKPMQTWPIRFQKGAAILGYGASSDRNRLTTRALCLKRNGSAIFDFPYQRLALALSGKVLLEHIANGSDGVLDAGRACCGGLLSHGEGSRS